jgi:hypothetical protein
MNMDKQAYRVSGTLKVGGETLSMYSRAEDFTEQSKAEKTVTDALVAWGTEVMRKADEQPIPGIDLARRIAFTREEVDAPINPPDEPEKKDTGTFAEFCRDVDERARGGK